MLLASRWRLFLDLPRLATAMRHRITWYGLLGGARNAAASGSRGIEHPAKRTPPRMDFPNGELGVRSMSPSIKACWVDVSRRQSLVAFGYVPTPEPRGDVP